MTPIQKESLPIILEGKDIIAQAKTGSGKTVAFGIGVLNRLNVKRFRIQTVILCPTRELANQVANEVRKLARCMHNVKVLTLCGGMPYKPQVNSLFHGAHILVGTPGRVLKHLSEENMNFDDVNTLVLDEADRMLDMGFNEDIQSIIKMMPKDRQSLLFSATFPEDIDELSQSILNNPTKVSVISKETVKIEEHFYQVKDENKTALLPALFSTYAVKSVVIFCNTKIKCDSLFDELDELGFDVLVLHSDFDQKERDETLTLFANKSYPILIATDVAARGLDIDDIDMVINYDVAKDAAVHTHRVGRTARAQKSGRAVTFVNEYDLDNMDEIQENITYLNTEKLEDDLSFKLDAPYRTLYINGGKKNKVRAGDILGSLIQEVGLQKDDVGKINIFNFYTYVAVKKEVEQKALKGLENGKIKGKRFKVYPR